MARARRYRIRRTIVESSPAAYRLHAGVPASVWPLQIRAAGIAQMMYVRLRVGFCPLTPSRSLPLRHATTHRTRRRHRNDTPI